MAERVPSLPEIPTVAEQGFPGYDVSAWAALAAPRGTPAEPVAAINRAYNEALKQDAVQQRLATLGAVPAGGTPEEHLEAGTWARAESLAALAEQIGVPAEALTASVERFNELAAAGEDTDFGRGRDEYDRYFADPVLVPVTEPPFSAICLMST